MIIEDYIQFVENDQSDLYGLKVKKGKYKDVIYTYGKVNISEDPENDQAKLTFDFKLESWPPKFKKKKLEKSTDFKNFMGDVLSQLLEDEIKNDELTNANTQDDN